MKNIFKSFALILFSAVVLTSCEEDKVVFDNVNGQTLLSFAATTQNIGVGPEDGQNVGYILVNSTTISNQDRAFTVQVSDASTAEAGVEYTLDQSTFVIPAGEYTARVKVTGNFDQLQEGENKTIVLTLVPDGNYALDTASTTVTLFRSCPVPADFFVGNYLLEQVSSEGADGPVLESGVVRPVTVDPNDPTRRIFTSYNFPNFCSSARNQFAFALVCGQIVVDGANTSNCICTQGTPYNFGPATVNETYNVEEGDAVILITFTNDVTANCGPADQVTYRLTKQ
jgi:hypothetical protein